MILSITPRLNTRPLRKHTLRAFSLILCTIVLAGGCTQQGSDAPARPAAFWPPAPNEPRIQFLKSFDKSADVAPVKSGLDEIIMGKEAQIVLPVSKPYGLRIWQGKIYVCDIKQKGVIVFDLKNKITKIIGVSGATKLANPVDIAIAPDGLKYVADQGAGSIVIFDANDRPVSSFTRADFKPIAVAVYQDELAVSDQKFQRIEILDRKTGRTLRVIGGAGMADGEFIQPISVAYNSKGILFVSDFMKCRIQKFDRKGQLVKAFGEALPVWGNFVRPKHIAIDAEDNLYVVDAAFMNVQIFNSSDRLLTDFGAATAKVGGIELLPVGVAISEDPADIELFRGEIHPLFNAQRLVAVTSQFSPPRVSVYALGKLKDGKTVADLAPTRVAVPASTQPLSTRPTTQPGGIEIPPLKPNTPEPKTP